MEKSTSLHTTILHSPFLLALIIFILALFPRWLDLGVFIGPDEFSWVSRTSNFSQALVTGEFAQTYQTGHPGVTVMWVDTLRSWLTGTESAALQETDKNMATLQLKRQGIAVANSLIVVGIVLSVRSLFGLGIAWITAILLVFDPFLLTESRALRTEGLVTGFNTLAVLWLLIYLKRPYWFFAIVAGLLTGMALLSKVSALVLLPIAVIALTIPLMIERKVSLKPYLIYGLSVGITVLLLWPAIWVDAVNVAQQMYDYLFLRAIEGGGGGKSFFLGRPYPEEDPGWLFYPVVIAYRTTPLMWLGLFLLLLRLKKIPPISNRYHHLGVILLYLLLYLGLITASQLKYDRYIIPMLPLLNILAALGLWAGWRWLISYRPPIQRLWGVAIGGMLILQIGTAINHHPYYYTFWNPLLGGISQAVHMLPVGTGGEGIDQIAAQLNQLPEPSLLTVASANSQKIAPLFSGETLPMTNLDGTWLLADYTFIHISQKQRAKHDPEILTYLAQQPLVHQVALQGLAYAWLYQGPSAQYWGGDTTLTGRATLHAYDLSAIELTPGQALTVTVYFRNDGQLPTDRLYIRLVDADGYLWANRFVQPLPGFETAFTQAKAFVEGQAVLKLPVGMPVGNYTIKMGYETDNAEAIGAFQLPSEHDTITVIKPSQVTALQQANPTHPLEVILHNEVVLLGFDLSATTILPADEMWLTLHWQALTSVSHDYVIAVQLFNQADEEVAYWLGRPVRSGYPTNEWQAHQQIQDPWRLTMPTDLAPSQYQLMLALFDAETQAQVITTPLQIITINKP